MSCHWTKDTNLDFSEYPRARSTVDAPRLSSLIHKIPAIRSRMRESYSRFPVTVGTNFLWWDLIRLVLRPLGCLTSELSGRSLSCIDSPRICIDIWPRKKTVERFAECSGAIQHLDSAQI